MSVKQSRIERQVWLRIRVSVAAYAYEVENNPIMSDAEFDRLCGEIDPLIETGRATLDDFFIDQFDPSTGMWIFKHPEIEGIKRLYRKHWGRRIDDLA